MKIKHIAAVTSAAVIVGAALPLTGCKAATGGASDFARGELDISKYAVEYSGSTNSFDAVTEAVSLGTQIESVDVIGSFIVTEKASKFAAYTDEGAALESGLDVKPTAFTESNTGATLLRTQKDNKYSFYMSDGFKLFEGSSVNRITVKVENKYIGEQTQPSTVWTVSEYGVSDGTSACYKVTYDNAKRVLTQLSASDINDDPPSVSLGGDYYGVTHPVYTSTANRPVEGAAAEYSYADVNDTRIFYKNGQETGRIDMTGVDETCFVGNYLYYTTNVMCSKDSGGNLTVVSQYGELKYEYALNKYDFVNNSHSSYNYNAVISDMTALYNKTDKTYDAISIAYMPVKNGVAQSVSQSFKYAVMDGEFRLVAETPISIGNSSSLYALGDGKYGYTGGSTMYVLDDKLSPVARVTLSYNSGYYKSAGLFSFNYNGKTGFTGLDGKVKIEPKYQAPSNSSNIYFYGDYARVSDAETDKELILKNDGTSVDMPVVDADTSVTDYAGWYTVEKSGSLSIYSLAGALLQSASGYDDINVIDDNLVYVMDDNGLMTVYLIK